MLLLDKFKIFKHWEKTKIFSKLITSILLLFKSKFFKFLEFILVKSGIFFKLLKDKFNSINFSKPIKWQYSIWLLLHINLSKLLKL